MKTLSYRDATAEDAAALAEFGAARFTHTFGHIYSVDDLRAYLAKAYDAEEHARMLSDARYYHIIAEDAEGIAAFLKAGPCALPIDTEGERAYELCRLYVHERCKGRGIGKQLVRLGLERARAERYDAVYLGVWENNFPAQTLYKSFGFSEVGEYGFAVGAHLDRELIYRYKPA